MWQEARKSDRKLIAMVDAAKKKAEKRAEERRNRGPDITELQDSLRVVGKKCKLHRDTGMHSAAENLQGFLPWNGKEDNLIDRFDGRALLDFIREYDPRRAAIHQQSLTDAQLEAEEQVAFESFRDIVRHLSAGLTEQQALRRALEEEESRRERRLQAERKKAGGEAPKASASKPGVYSRAAFSYDGSKGDPGNDDDWDFDDDDDEDNPDADEDEIEEDIFFPVDEDARQIALQYGIEDFEEHMERAESKVVRAKLQRKTAKEEELLVGGGEG